MTDDGRDDAGGRSRERLSDARWQAVLGIVLVAIGAMAGFGADRLIAHRQEVQENTRFVRQVVIDKAFDGAPDTVFDKPFRGLELRSAALARLQLGCDDTSTSPA